MAKKQKAPEEEKNKKKNLQQSKTQPAAGKNGVYTFLLDVAFAFGNM